MLKIIFMLVMAAGLFGCKRDDLLLNTRLAESESIEADAPVMLNGEPIGKVVAIFNQGSQRGVRLAVRADLSQPLRVGTIVAAVSSNGVELDSSAVQPGAAKIEPGAWLQRLRVSAIGALSAGVAKVAAEKIPWFGRQGLDRTSVLVGVVLLLVFVWMLRASITAGLVAMASAWLGHPFLLNVMAELLVKARANQAAVVQVSSSFDAGSAADTLERSLTGIFSQLPGPTVLSIACIFICTYLSVRFFQRATH